MGWLYDWSSKSELVAHLNAPTRNPNFAIIKTSLVGNHLWHLTEIVHGEHAGTRVITLYLLQGLRGGDRSWGYKDLDETVYPYHFDCPVTFLALAGEPFNENARQWREAVRKHHEKKKALRARAVSVGDVLNYGGHDYRLNYSLGRKGWDVTRVSDGVNFRMKAKQVSDALRALIGSTSAA